MFRTKYLAISIAVLGVACQETKDKRTYVIVSNQSDSTTDFILSQYHAFNLQENVLHKIAVAAKETDTLTLDIDEPSFIYYKSGSQYGSLLLAPGDEITVALPSRKLSGPGRHASDFLAKSRAISSQYETRNGVYYGRYRPIDFMDRMDSLTQQLQAFRDAFFDTTNISGKTRELLTSYHELILANYYQTYAIINDVTKLGSAGLRPLVEKASHVPVNDKVKNSHMVEYGMALQLYYDYVGRRLAPLVPEEIRLHKPDQFVKVLIDTALNSSLYPVDAKELFIAKTIDNGVNDHGITPMIDSLFNFFKQRFPQSGYTELIQRRYDKRKELMPGNNAPDFFALTTEGDTTHPGDFSGKLIYIDVWATWCMPCIAEFPASMALRRKFEENKNIVFMYVSVDDNHNAWQNFVTTNTNLKGVHLIDPEKTIWKAYQMSGVPRYILIGADGKIINADAPRPSSGEIEGILRAHSAMM